MTDLEKAKTCRKVALRSWAEVNQYSWDAEFSYKQIKESSERFMIDNPEYKVDIRNLSESDMDDLDFGKWSDDSDLRLIPLWLKPFCKSIEVISIMGNKEMLDEADNDNRFGCMAYGINTNG